MADAWGGSWGTRWASSWGAAAVAPPAVEVDQSGGFGGGGWFYEHPSKTYQRYFDRLKKREEELQEAATEPEQIEAIEAIAETVREIEPKIDVPALPAFDHGPLHRRIETARAALAAVERAIEAEIRRRERVRRNNNWLMMQ